MSMKKKVVCLVGMVIVFSLTLLGLYKIDGIYSRIVAIRTTILRSKESKWMHKETIDLSGYDALTDEPGAWYTKYHFISHSGGGIDGKTSTNSVEAWELSYDKGNRVIDADLSFTSDGNLVLRHNWSDDLEQDDVTVSGRMDYATFRDSTINYKFHPMSCEDMLVFMEEHADLYVACDMKDDVAESYQYLVSAATQIGVDDVLDRVIVSVYDPEEYDQVMEIYPFKNAAARQYRSSPLNYYELAQFCLDREIHAVNVWTTYMDDAGVDMLESYGIHIFAAVVDDISEMQLYCAAGSVRGGG